MCVLRDIFNPKKLEMSFLIAEIQHTHDKLRAQMVRVNALYGMLSDLNNDSSIYGKNSHKGYFCLARYDTSDNDQQFSRNISYLLKVAWNDPYHNWYIAPNTFRVHWTRTEKPTSHYGKRFNNIRVLTSFYFDFDVLNSGLSMPKFKHDLENIILPKCRIKPTAIINTTHGFHVYLILDKGIPANSNKITSSWKFIEKYLYRKIAKKCQKLYGKTVVDPKVTDINRILRVPLCFNMKRLPYHQVKIDYLNIMNRPKFSHLKKLSEKYAKKNGLKRLKRHRIWHNYNKIGQYKRYKARKHHKTGFSIRSLQAGRCSDIFTIAKLRKAEDIAKGYREESMFLYAVSAITIYNNKTIKKNLNELNRTFSAPCAQWEVNHVIKELPRIHDKVFSYKKGDKKFEHYIYTNAEYISELGITSREQQYMKTLIGPSENKKRYQERLNQRKLMRVQNRYDRNYQMYLLKLKGITYKTIAKTYRTSYKTVQRAIKSITQLGVDIIRTLSLVSNSRAERSREANNKISKINRNDESKSSDEMAWQAWKHYSKNIDKHYERFIDGITQMSVPAMFSHLGLSIELNKANNAHDG